MARRLRIIVDDGGPVDAEHLEIVEPLRRAGADRGAICEQLRKCERPAKIIELDPDPELN